SGRGVSGTPLDGAGHCTGSIPEFGRGVHGRGPTADSGSPPGGGGTERCWTLRGRRARSLAGAARIRTRSRSGRKSAPSRSLAGRQERSVNYEDQRGGEPRTLPSDTQNVFETTEDAYDGSGGTNKHWR